MKKDQSHCARWASTSRSGGFFGFLARNFPLTLPGTGGSRVQRHKFYISTAWMPRRFTVEGADDAGNAKGVFYDN